MHGHGTATGTTVKIHSSLRKSSGLPVTSEKIRRKRHFQVPRQHRHCTAVIDAASNPPGYIDQDAYLKALAAANSVDHIATGSYVARVKYAPLVLKAVSRSSPANTCRHWGTPGPFRRILCSRRT